MLTKEEQIDAMVKEGLRVGGTQTPLLSSRRSALWTFLNSSFGIFLMSSIVLAGFGKLYSQISSAAEQRTFEKREVIKLASEIELRLVQLEFNYDQMFRRGATDHDRYLGGLWMWRIVIGDSAYHPSINEFERTHIASLIWRLRLLGRSYRADQALRVVLDIERESGALDSKYDRTIVRRRLDILGDYRNHLLSMPAP